MQRELVLERVTLQIIASRAGLTKTTVSRILNGHPGYSEATRRRVLAMAEALGFRPNPISRALAGAGSRTLGFVVNMLDPLIASMLQAFDAAAGEAGYRTIVLGTSGNSSGDDASAIEDLLDRRVDGLVIDGDCPIPQKTQGLIDRAGLPVIHLRFAPPGARRSIVVDRGTGVGALARQLRAWGHEEAVFVHVASRRRFVRLYDQMFFRHFKKAGLALRVPGRFTLRETEAAMRSGRIGITADHLSQVYEMLRKAVRQGELPRLLVFPDDEFAMAGMAALADAGLRVPEDVQVTGHDNHPLGAVLRPGLTTVHEPCAEIGAMAFELMASVLKSPDTPAKLRVASKLILRGSAGPVDRKE